MSQIPGYMTVIEAAREIKRSHAQVTRYIKAGLLAYKSVGTQYLIPEKAVESFECPKRGNPNFVKRQPVKRRKRA
jgi:excisionase family DNA binding protein